MNGFPIISSHDEGIPRSPDELGDLAPETPDKKASCCAFASEIFITLFVWANLVNSLFRLCIKLRNGIDAFEIVNEGGTGGVAGPTSAIYPKLNAT